MNLADLTEEQARTIEAGVECDALVAEACGVDGEVLGGHFYVGETREDEWEPSIDANAAIDAADASKLWWDGMIGFMIGCTADGRFFAAATLFGDECADDDLAMPIYAPTFPLAICRAILVLHVRKNRKVTEHGVA